MDRLKPKPLVLDVIMLANLHSNMDRLKLKNIPAGLMPSPTFTFQYG